jgi:hypothetical protein
MSEYWYRGVYQSDSAVSFGADYEAGSFYAGTWMADVDDGIEFDIYAGFNFEMMGMPMYLGATGYYYSDNFDGNYEEMNAGVDMGFMSLDVAFAGQYEEVDAIMSILEMILTISIIQLHYLYLLLDCH